MKCLARLQWACVRKYGGQNLGRENKERSGDQEKLGDAFKMKGHLNGT